jgi:dolichol-phosphate mannosyltransferase
MEAKIAFRDEDVNFRTSAQEIGSSSREDLISIIVPTYHEQDNLLPLVVRISDAMSQTDRPYEVIIVDDDSRDGSDEVVTELNDLGYPVRLITRIGERGLSSAVIRGFSEAKGETLFAWMPI